MDLVVLVDDQNKQIGIQDKISVHTANTLLHRGFSLFLFNSKQELLMTKRAATKKTFPDIWTNTVCGHPGPNEDIKEAAKRRLKQELGITVFDMEIIDPNYRYRFIDRNGIMENEICPILITTSNAYPQPNPEETDDWKWMPWVSFLEEVKNFPDKYSPWSIEEAFIVDKYLKNVGKK
jgi:isopentenyl-diphosphate delta-isomerase